MVGRLHGERSGGGLVPCSSSCLQRPMSWEGKGNICGMLGFRPWKVCHHLSGTVGDTEGQGGGVTHSGMKGMDWSS